MPFIAPELIIQAKQELFLKHVDCRNNGIMHSIKWENQERGLRLL